MKTGTLIASVAAMMLLLAAFGIAGAQIPALFNYQVMLTDDTDEPIADQTVTMVFSLYDAPSSGTQLWTETQTPTTNSIGVVSVVLGSITPITFDFDAPYWLGVEVNGYSAGPVHGIRVYPDESSFSTGGDSCTLDGRFHGLVVIPF